MKIGALDRVRIEIHRAWEMNQKAKRQVVQKHNDLEIGEWQLNQNSQFTFRMKIRAN